MLELKLLVPAITQNDVSLIVIMVRDGRESELTSRF